MKWRRHISNGHFFNRSWYSDSLCKFPHLRCVSPKYRMQNIYTQNKAASFHSIEVAKSTLSAEIPCEAHFFGPNFHEFWIGCSRWRSDPWGPGPQKTKGRWWYSVSSQSKLDDDTVVKRPRVQKGRKAGKSLGQGTWKRMCETASLQEQRGGRKLICEFKSTA